MQQWYVIATGSDADAIGGGVIVGIPDQNGDDNNADDVDEVELVDDIHASDASDVSDSIGAVDFQIMLLLALGIIIGILLIGDRRF